MKKKSLEKKEDEDKEESEHIVEAKHRKGKEIVVSEPKATKKNKVIIIDPKLNDDLRKGVAKVSTP